MGFRLLQPLKIVPSITINLSKSGVSASGGVRGARVTLGPRSVRCTIGIPGTGLSYTATDSLGTSVRRTRTRPTDDEVHELVASVQGCLTLVVLIGRL